MRSMKSMWAAALAFTLLVATGCTASTDSTQKSALDTIKEKGVLVVGAECLYRGSCFHDPATGERSGLGVDLTEILAQDLGVRVEYRDMEFAALIPAVQSGQIDIVTQGMTKTASRALAVSMTDPVYWDAQVLVVPADSPLNSITEFDAVVAQLNSPETVMVFLQGSSQEQVSAKIFPEAQRTGLDITPAFQEVAAGRAHAMISGAGDAYDFIQTNPSVVIWQEQVIASEHNAFVVRLGDNKLLNYLNDWLEVYQANGTLRNLAIKWNEERALPAQYIILPPSG